MEFATFKFFLKALILLAAVVALAFGLAFIFFYEHFQVFNDLVNNRYLVRKKGYKGGSDYLIDSWIMGWHTGFGVVALLIAIWLFSVFFRYLYL